MCCGVKAHTRTPKHAILAPSPYTHSAAHKNTHKQKKRAEAKFLGVTKRRKRGKREEKGEERGREGGREGKEGTEEGEGGEVATIGPVARSFGWVSGRSGKRYGKRYVS